MFSWVEISRSAIEYNLAQFKKQIGKNLLMPVIKSNAYGHGLELIAKICDSNKSVNKICVVNSDEAKQLIELKIKKPIVILSFYTNDIQKLRLLANKEVEFPVYKLDQILLLEKVSKLINKKIKIHIKIDTGTSRVGFLPNEITALAKQLNKTKSLLVEGIWSHFASSETDQKYTKKQYDNFQDAVTELEKNGIQANQKHMACTAASLVCNFKKLNSNRLGLGIYGLYPEKYLEKKIKFKPALSWKTTIVQVKTLNPHTSIGYGSSFVTSKKTKIAILPTGYWDGYSRALSNKSNVIIKGHLCPVRGKICMNLMMVELPIKSTIKAGDIATLIGHDHKKKITVEELALLSGTINYEIITKINPLIARLEVK